MFTLYGLIKLLPKSFVPNFAPRHNKLYLFLSKHKNLDKRQAVLQYLGDYNRIKYFNKLIFELKTELTRYLIANPSWMKQHLDLAMYEECYRTYSSYKILLLNGERKAAIELARGLIQKLEKTELHAMIHIVANDLLFHYSCVEVSLEIQKKYSQLAKEQLEIINIEAEVRLYHSMIGFYANTKGSFTTKMINYFIETSEKSLLLLRPKLHHINRLIYSIVISRYFVVYDYEQVIKYCDEALDSFPPDHSNIRSLRYTFLYNKTSALLALSRLDEAKNIIKEACKTVLLGSYNWETVLSKRILVCFYSGDYQEAYDLYQAHCQKKYSEGIIVEHWEIIRGYLFFLIGQGKIETYEAERFNLGKFLNEVPVYSKDKSGNNINIIIIQILTRIQRNQFGHIIDWVDSLKAYARMYTRNPESKRANIFINMILKMADAHFHKLGTERKTKKLFEKLKATPLRLGQNLAIEIIPFEVLWQEVLSILEHKFHPLNKNKKVISKTKQT